MDATTLVNAMPGLDPSKAEEVLPDLLAAMARGEITTLRRAQYFLAQLGHESASLRYFEEIASGDAYEGRHDLGNTQPGDGSPVQGTRSDPVARASELRALRQVARRGRPLPSQARARRAP